MKDDHGTVVISAIKTYGETIHKFVERKNYKGAFLPGYGAMESRVPVEPVGLPFEDEACAVVVGEVATGHETIARAKFVQEALGTGTADAVDARQICLSSELTVGAVRQRSENRECEKGDEWE